MSDTPFHIVCCLPLFFGSTEFQGIVDFETWREIAHSVVCRKLKAVLFDVCFCVVLQYCHYVAGLVGIGLSRLFSVSKLEDAAVGSNTKLSNSMGLFLQKTNIIRDYLEDVQLGRHFWPWQVTTV